MHAGSRRVGAGEDARVGERYQGDGAPSNQNRDDVRIGNPRDRERRQASREGAQDRHVSARGQVQRPNDCSRANDGNQYARYALAVLEKEDHRQCAGADRERRPVNSAAQDRLGYRPQFSQRSIAFDREPEEFGQLADQYRQRYTIHIAIADRLGEKLGYEAQTRRTCQNADDPRDDRHHAGQGDGASGVSARQREDNAEYDSGQR